MSDPAARLWDQVCDLIDSMGVLTVVDGLQLERYVIYFLRWRQQERVIIALAQDDATLAVSLGVGGSRAALKAAYAESHRLDDALRRMEAQFGLTPASRAHLTAHERPSEDATNEEDLRSYFA